MIKYFRQTITALVFIGMVGACSSESESNYIERMAKEHEKDAPVENASSELQQSAQVTGEEVTYATLEGEKITGYLAKGDSSGKTPGIIVIHEWWGLNDNIRSMTDKLAGEGYIALAVDLYNGNVAETPSQAKEYTGSVDDKEAMENLMQAYSYLSTQEQVTDVGVIGWCFGGGWSLLTALGLPDKIEASVIYYGQLVTDPEQLNKLDMPILGIFGAEDDGIPVEQVKEFESALNEVGVENTIRIYKGADHAFANPSGNRYQKEAAEKAWQETTSFLDEHLKGE